MIPRDAPTMPPSAADEKADLFVVRLLELEQARRAQGVRPSGMIRIAAEAWASVQKESE